MPTVQQPLGWALGIDRPAGQWPWRPLPSLPSGSPSSFSWLSLGPETALSPPQGGWEHLSTSTDLACSPRAFI